MKRFFALCVLYFVLSQAGLTQSNLKHRIFAEAGGATFLYCVGYEIGWLNKEKISMQSSIGYGYWRFHNLNLRTDVSFLKSNYFLMNFGAGYCLGKTYGITHLLNLHLGPEFLLFDKRISLHPYFMSGIYWGWTQGSGPWYRQKEYFPFWGGFRLKYTFFKKEKK